MADEYIWRKDAAKLLGYTFGVDVVKKLHEVPAADVAPVVRRKDCKYGDYDSKPDGAMVCLRTKDGFWRKETDFCSYGERRDGGPEDG